MRADPIRLAQNATDNPELEPLLNPAAAFKHPRDVVRDPDLTLNGKRAILSSWAWACAVELAADVQPTTPRCRRHLR